MFNNIITVPDDLVDEALEIIEDIGASSPEPELLISKIEDYMNGLYDFMIKNFESGEFVKYKTQSDIP